MNFKNMMVFVWFLITITALLFGYYAGIKDKPFHFCNSQGLLLSETENADGTKEYSCIKYNGEFCINMFTRELERVDDGVLYEVKNG
jgi:hypothetical protein